MKFLLGLILYCIDPDFRHLVKAKAKRGPNETVKTGETVICVLKRAED